MPKATVDKRQAPGYIAGWKARDEQRVFNDFKYWHWGEWAFYTWITVVVAGVCVAVAIALTGYLSWVTNHPQKPAIYQCYNTTSNSICTPQ